jgi:hypothetical protein
VYDTRGIWPDQREDPYELKRVAQHPLVATKSTGS